MKPYTKTEPNFSETIEITEVGDPGHADYLNAAPKQLLENTLVNKGDIEELQEKTEGLETWKDSTQQRLDNCLKILRITDPILVELGFGGSSSKTSAPNDVDTYDLIIVDLVKMIPKPKDGEYIRFPASTSNSYSVALELFRNMSYNVALPAVIIKKMEFSPYVATVFREDGDYTFTLFAWKYPILAISLATGERGPDISIPNVNYNPANIYVKIGMNTVNDELYS